MPNPKPPPLPPPVRGADSCKRLLRGAHERLGVLLYHVVFRGSVAMALLVGLLFTIYQFHDLGRDTTAISNTAFGVLAILSSLAFSCARSQHSDEAARERFTYSGERFLHGAVSLLVASLLKYAVLAVKSTPKIAVYPLIPATVEAVLGLVAAVMFFWAVMAAHTGLKVMSDLLRRRITKFPDWDDIA